MGDKVFDFYDTRNTDELRKLCPEAILEEVGDDIPDDVLARFAEYLASKAPRTRARIKAIVLLYTGNVTRLSKIVGISRTKVHDYLKIQAVREAIEDRHPSENLKHAIADRDEILTRWTTMARDESLSPQYRQKADELLGKAQMMFVEKRILQDETTLGAALRDLAEKGSPAGHGAGEVGPALPEGGE